MAEGSGRPTVATVFGVLHIIFGLIGLLALRGLKFQFSLHVLTGIFSLLGICLSVLLLVAGIFLVLNKKMAVDLSKYYAFASLGLTVIHAIYLIATSGIAGLIVAIVAILIGIIYPLLVLFLLVKNETVISFYSSQP